MLQLNAMSGKLTENKEMMRQSLDTTSLSDPALRELTEAVPIVEIGIEGFEVIVFKTELTGSVVDIPVAGVQVANPKLERTDDTSLDCRLYLYLVSINLVQR